MIIEADAYFAHHGVKGQKWGVRNDLRVAGAGAARAAKATGREAVKVAKATGRGTVATGKFIGRHKKGVAIGVGTAAVVGATATLVILKHNSNLKLKDLNKRRSSFEASKRLIDMNHELKLQEINKAATLKGITSLHHPDAEKVWKQVDALERSRQNKLTLAKLNAMKPNKSMPFAPGVPKRLRAPGLGRVRTR